MVLTLGTNCGFVTVAPTANPSTGGSQIDDRAFAFKDTSPATAAKITEIGWFCNTASEEANFEVGIYAHDSGNNKPDTLIVSFTTNAKGTGLGWKVVTGLDITISQNTDYWIGVQLDNVTTTTFLPTASDSGANKFAIKVSQTSLPDPWGTSALENNFLAGIYVVWEAAAPAAGNSQMMAANF